MSDIKAILKQVTRLFTQHGWADYDDSALQMSRLIGEQQLSASSMKKLPDTFFIFNRVSRNSVLDALKMITPPPDIKVANSAVSILVLSASPSFASDVIRVDKELRSIIKRVRTTTNRDQINLNILPATEPGDIIDEINRVKPSILQISSHGGITGLLLDGETAQEGALTADQLNRIIKTASSVKTVILNSCHSFEQAKALVKYVDIAVGMKSAIGDDAAISFSGQFYSSLAEGVSVETAFEQALISIDFKSSQYTDVPKIYVAKGVKLNNYFITTDN